jgi:hypothetical protein
MDLKIIEIDNQKRKSVPKIEKKEIMIIVEK